jgi:hypothetical protein
MDAFNTSHTGMANQTFEKLTTFLDDQERIMADQVAGARFAGTIKPPPLIMHSNRGHYDGECLWDEYAQRSTLWFAIYDPHTIREFGLNNAQKIALSFVREGASPSIQTVHGTPGIPGYTFVCKSIFSQKGSWQSTWTSMCITMTWTLREVSDSTVAWDVHKCTDNTKNKPQKTSQKTSQSTRTTHMCSPSTMMGRWWASGNYNWDDVMNTYEQSGYLMAASCYMPCVYLCDCSLQSMDDQGKTTEAKLTHAGITEMFQEEADAIEGRLRAALNSHLSEPGAVVSSLAVAPVHNTMPERFDLQHTGVELKNATVYRPPPVPFQQPYNPNNGHYNPNNARPPPVPAQQSYNPNNADNPIHAHATGIINPLVAMERLSKLKSLLDTGVISEDEFNSKRGPLLDAM